MPRLSAIHPVVAAGDVELALEFYARLGFQCVFQDDPSAPRYAVVRRDRVELHLQWHADAAREDDGDRPVYRVEVDDVDGLYAEFGDAGALPETAGSPWAAPGDTTWGTREFHLRDPYGNGLQFYRRLAGGGRTSEGESPGPATSAPLAMRTRSIVALLEVAGVERALEFYAKLGLEVADTFTEDGQPHLAWALLRSEGAQLMLARTGEDRPSAGPSGALLYFYCDDVPTARAALEANGVPCGEIRTPFYAPRGEFEVRDPDGLLVVVTHT